MAVFKRADRGNLFKESTNLEIGQGVVLQKLKADMYCKSLALSGPGALVDKEGELLEDNCLKTGQKGMLNLGNVTVGQYHLLLEPKKSSAFAGTTFWLMSKGETQTISLFWEET